MKITKAQLDALRRYADAMEDGSSICLVGCWKGVHHGTHRALLRKGLLEVAVARPPVEVRRTFAYNFGRNREYRFSHLECGSRFRLTAAGREAIGG
jgi:hypothetical protein